MGEAKVELGLALYDIPGLPGNFDGNGRHGPI